MLVRTWASAAAVLVPPLEKVIEEIAALTAATDEWVPKLKRLLTPDEKVTTPTRVLPLSMSSLSTSCDRNDFIRLKLVVPILPDPSSTKMMSAGQSVGVDLGLTVGESVGIGSGLNVAIDLRLSLGTRTAKTFIPHQR